MKRNYIYLLLLVFLQAACQSRVVRVESDPAGADVMISAPNQTPKKVGQTPYQLVGYEVGSSNEPFFVTLSKDGFASQSVVLPPATFGRSGNLFFKMVESKLPLVCQNQEASIEKVARGVAEVQNLIKAKSFDRAEVAINTLISDYPSVSVFYDLLGNALYLRRDIKGALNAYRRSMSLQPANLDTTRMIKKLEGMSGSGGAQ